MNLMYEEKKAELYLVHKISRHFPPHLHDAIEMIYVTDGTLEVGVGQELFHMEKGDFAIVFPNMIHHYQVFSKGISKAYYLSTALSLSGPFREELQRYCPENPVIRAAELHSDIPNAIRCLFRAQSENAVIWQSYVQIILARSMPHFKLVERSFFSSDDIIYQTVSYIAANFREELTLEGMARKLGVSKYVLSRVFSATFHKNFNQYVNEQRLNYVIAMLEETEESITDICLDAGFQSQRTFNRVFQETYRMTPREYRNYYREKNIVNSEVRDEKKKIWKE